MENNKTAEDIMPLDLELIINCLSALIANYSKKIQPDTIVELKKIRRTVEMMKEYHSQSKPSKSIDDCLNEVAKKYRNDELIHFSDFNSMLGYFTGIIPSAIAYELKNGIKEAMQLYLEQGKNDVMNKEYFKWLEDEGYKLFQRGYWRKENNSVGLLNEEIYKKFLKFKSSKQ